MLQVYTFGLYSGFSWFLVKGTILTSTYHGVLQWVMREGIGVWVKDSYFVWAVLYWSTVEFLSWMRLQLQLTAPQTPSSRSLSVKASKTALSLQWPIGSQQCLTVTWSYQWQMVHIFPLHSMFIHISSTFSFSFHLLFCCSLSNLIDIFYLTLLVYIFLWTIWCEFFIYILSRDQFQICRCDGRVWCTIKAIGKQSYTVCKARCWVLEKYPPLLAFQESVLPSWS